MAQLNQALFRIDPTEGLLQYVQAIKPYHTKVLDVFVEYIYSEPLSIVMTDRSSMTISLGIGCSFLPIVDADIVANTLTVTSMYNGQRRNVEVGSQFYFSNNINIDNTYLFTVMGVDYLAGDICVITIMEPLAPVSHAGLAYIPSGPSASTLGEIDAINGAITTGTVVIGCPTIPPIVYSCGFGFIWNPYNAAQLAQLPQANIISAGGALRINATPVVSTAMITLSADPSGYTFPIGQEVAFATTGTLPSPLVPGNTYYVNTSTLGVITVSATVGGNAISFSTGGTGALSITPQNIPYNSFLVSTPTATQYTCVVSDVRRNQITLATPFNITSVDPSLSRFVVIGDLVSGITVGSTIVTVAPGDTIYVTGNSDTSTNGKYTVDTCIFDTGLTTITTVESVSLVATASGRLGVPLDPDATPYWPAGTAVQLSCTGAFPAPVTVGSTYYFNPTTIAGVFNLASTRYPQAYDEIIDLLTLETGQLRIFQSEPFVPGQIVMVSGSYLTLNDGQYLINTIEKIGANFRVTVLQHVPQYTPVGLSTDGSMVYTGSFGDPYCAVVTSPDLYTSAFFHERISFVFGPLPGYALFAGGSTSLGISKNTNKYTYATNVVTNGSLLIQFRTSFGACGNSMIGLFAGGNAVSGLAETYVFASDVVSTGATLAQIGTDMTSVGNSTLGVVGGKSTGAVGSVVHRYTYASNTVTTGAALSHQRSMPAAAGNSIVGYFFGGAVGNGSGSGAGAVSTDKYTYASNVISTGTGLSTNQAQATAVGTSATAVIAGGFSGLDSNEVTTLYTYASDTRVAGTNLRAKRFGMAAAGNIEQGIFTGGYLRIGAGDVISAVTDIYTYNTNTVTSGTNLAVATTYLAGVSSTPGAF